MAAQIRTANNIPRSHGPPSRLTQAKIGERLMAERSTADDSYGLQVWQVASTAVRNWSNARTIGSNHGLDIAR